MIEKKKESFYEKIEIAIILILFTLMVVVIAFSVTSRYIFSFTFSWAEQFTRLMFVWVTFAGISLAGKRGAHMRVSAITMVVGEKAGRWVFILGDAVCALFGFFISYKIYGIMMVAIQRKQVFTAMPWMPVWIMHLAGVIGMAGFAVRCIQVICEKIAESKAINREKGE
jgi:TRAP-type C4-dicarboxylate transport system permease small subunit